jgi:amidophosphoribosyltransferase
VRWPCFYGIDFASRAELIANAGDVESVRRSIGADTLAYVSLEGLIAATEQPKNRLCAACFTGDYPIAIPDQIGKHVLEGIARTVASPTQVNGLSPPDPLLHGALDAAARGIAGDAAPVAAQGYGAEDALSRP